jgi:hypothetical protein
MGFMKWQAEFGSDYLKISAYITFGMFVIFGIIAFKKTRTLYWLIGVAVGSVIFGFCMFWLMNQASHSKTLSQIAAFGAEANMVSDLMNPNRFNSSKRRMKTKR